MTDHKEYDISSVNMRVKVYFNSKMDHYIGRGTVQKVYIVEDGSIHIDTIMMDSGQLFCSAGLGVVPTEE